ncbi:hypothetical protein BDN72DRAFT_406899 [Pluteus cervinus]|uniref:Uncharacterized protein n=1 Tax=Pluteus cervinus TaxID=181527 RepID=A0ACD3AB66_9AGAR|nr:hypothetical protein BDN72DRAFT_406899 [Pluteus cervinus]
MPATEAHNHLDERDRDRDHEKGDRLDRGDRNDRNSKQKAAAPSAKSKDLSHVPCKFYKVGGCTAGSSCPFSHSAQEPGHQKEPCAWFIKGNCKFGHKCALAHILPGQPMSMDRKNKKQAQQAAAAAGGGPGIGPGGAPSGHKNARSKKDFQAGGARNPLLAGGSTAPTRMLGSQSSGGRPPMGMLKATISPSAPAPPLKDTDFPSFSALDESTQLPNAPAQGRGQDGLSSPRGDLANTSTLHSDAKASPNNTPSPLPMSAPRNNSSIPPRTVDYGPIGSPPVTSQLHSARSPSRQPIAFSPGTSPRPVRGHANSSSINGVNLATSPSRGLGLGITSTTPHASNVAGVLSSSPFSAPGTQTSFMSYGENTMRSGMAGLGVASSLGTGLAFAGGRKGWGNGNHTPGNEAGNQTPLSSSFQARSNLEGRPITTKAGEYEFHFEYDDFQSNRGRVVPMRGAGNDDDKGDTAVEDGDMEDFIPGSLTDLLTPEERSRRMSRSNSGQTSGAVAIALGATAAGSGAGAGASTAPGHRYSRSVPAPSLLGDIKSIWSDNNAPPLPVNNALPITPTRAESTVNAETGSVGSIGANGSPSLSMLSPSNASAAFLPGFHTHYRAQQQQGPGSRHVSNPLYGTRTALSPPTSHLSNYRPSPFDLTQSPLHNPSHPNHAAAAANVSNASLITSTNVSSAANTRPIPATTNTSAENPAHAVLLSPSTRALQSHAPGQSLPQGLAAGYSRIHALPPLPNVSSPGSAGGYGVTPPNNGSGQAFQGIDWGTGTSPTPNTQTFSSVGAASGGAGNPGAGTMGLDMFSRLSYSAATNRGPTASGGASNTNPSVPPGLSRNFNGGRYQPGLGPLPHSPLGGPVVTPMPGPMRDDDDDLFRMDR